MSLIIGLDTGGTYTDGVLFDAERGVLAKAKALTTQHDLSIGLRNALRQVVSRANDTIDRVCISTTLATNSVVEGHRTPIALILIGFDAKVLLRGGLGEALGSDPVAFVAGGHDPHGDQEQALDEAAARAAIEEMAPRVSGFAVAGRFAVRNHDHEERVRDWVRQSSGLPVTCSHEISPKLDAPKRALTTVLNARLIPQLQHLIEAVQGEMQCQGIAAPLMVVKGDGSLEDASIALHRPVETVLSGPAASVVGAQHLSGEDHCVVVDMGGTTTDIALLNRGVPVVDEDGAWLADWHTMVEAVSVHTFGLGGDSAVSVAPGGEIRVGPRRCVPVSLLIHLHPELLPGLHAQQSDSPRHAHGHFAMRLRALPRGASLTRQQAQLWELLEDGPVSLSALESRAVTARALDALVDQGLVIRCGFTPSDAAHVLRRYGEWSAEGAEVAAALWMRKQTEGKLFESVEAFSAATLEVVTRESARRIIDALISESSEYWLDGGGELGRALVDWYLNPRENAQRLIRPAFEIDRALVAIGAPAATYYPAIAERLNVRLNIPEHAEVANAVGAASAGIMQLVSILVSTPEEKTFRVHVPDGVRDFQRLDDAYALASQTAADLARERAERAGGVDIQLSEHRNETLYRVDFGEEVLVESVITAKALGRPR